LPDETLQRGPSEVKFGGITVNFPSHQAFVGGKPIHLTPVEFKLLGIFVKEPDRVFSREQLIKLIFGYDFEGFDRTIDVHILNLRRKLETNPDRTTCIRSVYGAGFKLTGSAE